MRPGRELGNELKSFKHRFFNVKMGNGKGKAKANGKKPAAAPESKPEQPATAKELREQQKAQKPLSKSFVRLSPKMPKLR